MVSSLDCIGLGVSDADDLVALLRLLEPHLTFVARADGLDLLRYDDPTGARLDLSVHPSDGLVDLLPSYAGPPGAELRALTPLADEVVAADVWDAESDELATRLCCDLLQWRRLAGRDAGRAAISAFGVEIEAHADVAAFDAARPDDGLPFGAESFVSYGLFAGADDPPTPHALLNGTVLSSATHTVTLTGQTFHACRVRTVGFEAEVLLAASEHPGAPLPGSILGGSVTLVADLAEAAAPTRGRWWSRR